MRRRAPERAVDIEALFDDGRTIEATLRLAVREALLVHKKLGHSIVVAGPDGKPVLVPPEEIEVDATPVRKSARRGKPRRTSRPAARSRPR